MQTEYRIFERQLLPELKLRKVEHLGRMEGVRMWCEKQSAFEVCPKCAHASSQVHDRRWVHSRDLLYRGLSARVVIQKRRFRCPRCKAVFTEPVPGIRKGYRTSERFRRGLLWGCENFTDLKRVQREFRISSSLLYKVFYEQLELKTRMKRKDFPEVLGIDEHAFKRNKRGHYREFASVLVDMKNKKIFEVVEGKSQEALREALHSKLKPENVRLVVLDMSDGYRSFVRSHFPNARMVADKFHVLRLLSPTLIRYRKITVDRDKKQMGKLLLRNAPDLDYWQRTELQSWLNRHAELKEVYMAKEALHRFYRTRGYWRASIAFNKLIEQLQVSLVPEVRRLKRTLLRWKEEILNHFEYKITNARTEGFNNKAKLLQRRAFGYKSFKNYRLRLLTA